MYFMNATEKLGIGKFETTEQFAKELESKNKTEIAARVREIKHLLNLLNLEID